MLTSELEKPPLVNLSIIGSRPGPVVKDGVWIEVESSPASNGAVRGAQTEEKRLQACTTARSKQLKKFRREVCKRVNQNLQIQGKVFADAQSAKMQREQEILCRSASAAEKSTPKKNRCLYNINSILIDRSGNVDALCRSGKESSCDVDPLLDVHAQQSVEVNRNTRRRLAERSILPLHDEDKELPGGVWGAGASRDKSPARFHENSSLQGDMSDNDEFLVETVPAFNSPDDLALTSVQETINCGSLHSFDAPRSISNHKTSKELPQTLHFIHNKVHFEGLPRQICAAECKEVVQCPRETICEAGVESAVPMNKNVEVQHDAPKMTSKMSRRFATIPALIHPGVVEVDRRRADEQARWMSRRVFSDAERERSREQKRLKKHRAKLEKLRAEKEQARSEVEQMSRDQIEAVQLANEQLKVEALEEERKVRERKERDRKKSVKLQRFTTALRTQLKDRAAQHKLDLPPLCACSSSFWDTNPDACANNCLFYRNNEAYAKALDAVLKALEKNTAPFEKDALQRSAISLPLVADDYDVTDTFSNERFSTMSILDNDS
ncbi:uncharacterized protein LOC143470871 [Clavelina lepadiformis]|uniref:uncharacterized protein LOC143470871 n=1 Tax=Clavelina lepadiformis TaxID=159417 RepID=UPI004041BD21